MIAFEDQKEKKMDDRSVHVPDGRRDGRPSCRPAKADRLWQAAWHVASWLITLDYSILMQAVFSRVSNIATLAPKAPWMILRFQKHKLDIPS